MKNRKYILAALAALSLFSCGGKAPEPDPVRLTATPNILAFTAEGGSQEVSITTDIKPDVSCADAWISLQEGSFSSNTFKLSVTAQANTGTTERRTSIRIIGNKMSLMVPVTQGVPPIKLAVDTDKLSFDCFGGESAFQSHVCDVAYGLHRRHLVQSGGRVDFRVPRNDRDRHSRRQPDFLAADRHRHDRLRR